LDCKHGINEVQTWFSEDMDGPLGSGKVTVRPGRKGREESFGLVHSELGWWLKLNETAG
jgi:hypothetical protein